MKDGVSKKKKISVRRKFFKRLARYPNLFIIYRTVAIILVWSGIWGLSDELIFPDNPLVRSIIVFLAGLTMLYVDDYSLSELIDIRHLKDHEEEFEEKIEHATDEE